MEVREELSTYGYDGDEIPVIAGSALCEIENTQPELGRERILELIEAVDTNVPEPERNPDEPLFMSIETVLNNCIKLYLTLRTGLPNCRTWHGGDWHGRDGHRQKGRACRHPWLWPFTQYVRILFK